MLQQTDNQIDNKKELPDIFRDKNPDHRTHPDTGRGLR
jgi:hypothetical protein